MFANFLYYKQKYDVVNQKQVMLLVDLSSMSNGKDMIIVT